MSLWVSVFVVALGFAGASRPASALVTDYVVLTVGYWAGSCSSDDFGYSQVRTGSVTPSILTGGRSIYAFAENLSYGGCSTFAALTVSPAVGTTWLDSISCDNGYSKNASAATYSYNSLGATFASWTWLTTFRFDQVGVGSQVTCAITHF
jgi:hypothetical protein